MKLNRLLKIILLAVAFGGLISAVLWAISVLHECGIFELYFKFHETLFFILGILFWGLSCFHVGMKFFFQISTANGSENAAPPNNSSDRSTKPQSGNHLKAVCAFSGLLLIACGFLFFKFYDSRNTPTAYFVRLADKEYGEVWPADNFKTNEGRLNEAHPDAFIAKLSRCSKDDELPENADIVVWVVDNTEAELWDGMKYHRKKAKLWKKYPNANVYRVL